MHSTRHCVTLLAVLVLAMIAPQRAEAQHPQTRHGFWFNVGFGYGTLGCQDCNGREGGFSGGLALGGTLSDKVMLGVATNGWTKTEGGATLTAGTVTAALRFYPSRTGGFFLLGGLGLGTLDAGVDAGAFQVSASETGAGALIGLGYDIRVARNLSLTPFWNGLGMTFDGGDVNVGQIGFGLTVH